MVTTSFFKSRRCAWKIFQLTRLQVILRLGDKHQCVCLSFSLVYLSIYLLLFFSFSLFLSFCILVTDQSSLRNVLRAPKERNVLFGIHRERTSRLESILRSLGTQFVRYNIYYAVKLGLRSGASIPCMRQLPARRDDAAVAL